MHYFGRKYSVGPIALLSTKRKLRLTKLQLQHSFSHSLGYCCSKQHEDKDTKDFPSLAPLKVAH